MRKNTVETFKAWVSGRKCKKTGRNGASIWTDGETVYSYGTAIMRRKGDTIALNVQKYSSTTSNHQNTLRILLEEDRIAKIALVSEPSDLF